VKKFVLANFTCSVCSVLTSNGVTIKLLSLFFAFFDSLSNGSFFFPRRYENICPLEDVFLLNFAIKQEKKTDTSLKLKLIKETRTPNPSKKTQTLDCKTCRASNSSTEKIILERV